MTQLIVNIDRRMQARNSNISAEELAGYKSAIEQLEQDLLRRAEIILCTCSVSAMKKIQQATKVYQVELYEFSYLGCSF